MSASANAAAEGTCTSNNANATIDLDQQQQQERWSEPLPHAHSPTKYYLSYPSRKHTRAAVLLMHGRGSSANDISDAFVPFLQYRFGGELRLAAKDGDNAKKEEEEEEVSAAAPVTVVAIEARDNTWYPNSHHATDPALTAESDPFQYSAMDKIRSTILDLHLNYGIPLGSIVFAGFSQGGLLGNSYLLAGLDQQLGRLTSNGDQMLHSDGGDDGKRDDVLIPLPGYMLSLAGSLFKTPPSFPHRPQPVPTTGAAGDARHHLDFDIANACPKNVRARLICGLEDRHFTADDIKDAAAQIGTRVRALDDAQGTASSTRRGEGRQIPKVVLSVALEEEQGHVITPRMVAAVAESLDEILAASAAAPPAA